MCSISRRRQNIAPVADNDPGFFDAVQHARSRMQASTLLANDNDADGDPLVITGVSNAVNGTVAFNSQTNNVTFTPTGGYSGAASFTYTISDGHGGTASAQVSLNVDRAGRTTRTCFRPTATPAIVTVNDSGDVESRHEVPGRRGGLDHRHPLLQRPQTMSARRRPSVDGRAAHCSQPRPSPTRPRAAGSRSDLAQQVAIQANTTYVVSYHSNGFYSATGQLLQLRVRRTAICTRCRRL